MADQIVSQNLPYNEGNVTELPQVKSPRGDFNSIVDAVIKTESSGQAHAVGKAGEIGLMQIMPQTGIMLGVRPDQLFDPAVNRQTGTRYLNILARKYGGDMEKALQAYNAGPHAVDAGKVPASAQSYARKVLSLAGRLLGEGTAEAEELPPGWSDPSKSSGAPALPSGWSEPSKPAPSGAASPQAAPRLPWPVRAGDWAPMAGQFLGETGGALAGGGAASVPGAMAGSVLGNDAGERIRNAVRAKYGLPQSSPGEILASDLMSGGTTGLFNKFLTPGARKAVTEAQAGYKAARDEAETALGGLEKLLGKTRGGAAQDAESAASGRALKDTVKGAENKAFDALSAQYKQILGPFYGTKTGQLLNRTFAREESLVKSYAMDIPAPLREKILNSPPTVQSAQEIASIASRLARQTPDDKGVLKSALGRISRAAQDDVANSLNKPAQDAYRLTNRQWAETVDQFTKADKIVHSPNLPSAANQFFKQESSSLAEHLNAIDKLPTAMRDKSLASLRDGYGSMIMTAVNKAETKGPVAQIQAATKFIETTDDATFRRLFPGVSKESWAATAKNLIDLQGEMLAHPDEAAAIDAGLKKYIATKSPHLLAYIQKHLGFSLAVLGAGALGASQYGVSPNEVGFLVGGLAGVSVWMSAGRSVRAAKMFQEAVKSPTAAKAFNGILRALDVAAAEWMKDTAGVGRQEGDLSGAR